MIQMLSKKMKNRKGFTLIELIVVIAILGIIALIAIPRFAGIQAQSRLNADGATAAQIINSARILDAQEDRDPDTTPSTIAGIEAAGLMDVPDEPQHNAGDFVLGYTDSTASVPGFYTVTVGTGGPVYNEETGFPAGTTP